MRLRYSFALPLLALSLSGIAQSLNQGNNAPVIGEVFIQHRGPYIDPGAPGTGQSWDFSALQATTTLTSTIQAAASTPNGASFPGATVAASAGGDNYAYMKITSTGLENVGVYGSSTVMAYQNPELLLQYPCALNTTWTDSWSTTFVSGGFPIVRAGTTTGLADGIGTVIMPYGTFNNVLRVKLTQQYSDDIGGMATVDYTCTNHYFYLPGTHMALAQVNYLTATTGGSTQTETYAAWLDASNVGITEAQRHAIGMELFPNPATDQAILVFSSTGGMVALEVTDAMGRLVHSGQVQAHAGIVRHALSLEALSPGLYQVRLIDAAGNQGVQRLVVE